MNQKAFDEVKKMVENYVQSADKYRCCVLLIKGEHKSGKSVILKKLDEYFLNRMKIINYNSIYADFFQDCPDIEKQNIYKSVNAIWKNIDNVEIVAIDHLEHFYRCESNIDKLFQSIVHQSRSKRVNNHPLVIIITFPTNDNSLSKTQSSLEIFSKIKESIDLIDVDKIKKGEKNDN